jgi:hypothetical protein
LSAQLSRNEDEDAS